MPVVALSDALPIKAPPPLGTDRSALTRLWDAVEATVGLARAFFTGRLIEIHVDEPIDDLATPILHGLRRKPFGYVPFRQDANSVPYTNYEAWTANTLAPRTAAGTMTISFILFALVAAIGLEAGATCTYGYAQADPVRFWVCDAAADATTGAREGDTRYVKATDVLQTFDGTVWATIGGGGGGAPTTATYITATPDATLVNEIAMSALGTGLQLNTTGTGAQSIYAGTSCTNQFPRSLSASGVATCEPVDLTADTTGTVPTDRGGTAADSSSSSGVARVSVGVWSFDAGISHLASSTSAALRGVLSDEAGTGAALFGLISTMTDDLGCTASQVVRRNATDTAFECATPSSGGGNAVEVSINLGSAGGLIYSTTVTGQSWVLSTSNIVCTPAATAADGLTVETVYAAGATAVVSNKVVGTGFDMAVFSPRGATGTYRFSCLGV